MWPGEEPRNTPIMFAQITGDVPELAQSAIELHEAGHRVKVINGSERQPNLRNGVNDVELTIEYKGDHAVIHGDNLRWTIDEDTTIQFTENREYPHQED